MSDLKSLDASAGFRAVFRAGSRIPLAFSPDPVPTERRSRPLATAARMLHVLNGDVAADSLRLSGVPGEITLSADVLHEGPTPFGLMPERWRKVRARYHA